MVPLSEKKRVVVVVNKWWECDPIMFTLTNDYVRPYTVLGWPEIFNYPHSHRSFSEMPRAVFTLEKIQAEIWCISDLLAKYTDDPCHQSSSELKMKILPNIFDASGKPPDLVIAVGTASAYPNDKSFNGSVIIGGKVFLHNGHPFGENKCSDFREGPFDQVMDSLLTPIIFDEYTRYISSPETVTKLLLNSKHFPAEQIGILTDYNFVNLSTINVTDYTEYGVKDRETLKSYSLHYYDNYARSLETTHGLIKIAAGLDTPFMFVSGIVDRLDHFSEDVGKPPYCQNTVGAHNAGVALAWLLACIEITHGSSKRLPEKYL